MPEGLKTLTRYTIEQEHRHPGSSGEFSALVNVLATATKIIANRVTRGRIVGSLGAQPGDSLPSTLHRRMDAIANDIMVSESQWTGPLAALLSEQTSSFHPVPSEYRRGKYLLAFDPLDGSSNIDVNLPVGTIFSVLRAPEDGREPGAADFLQPGTRQVCAGFTLYGPATMLVLTTGTGVDGFTLDREIGAFVLTHPRLRIPEDTSGFAINAANERFWERPVRRYVHECLEGVDGPRGRDFNMRWVASLVADTFHILTRGGVYLYPYDTRSPGRVSLLYGANPIAFVVEQAGGAATTGREQVLQVQPRDLHQRVPLIFGSRHEVERIEHYHRHPDEGPRFDASLFGTRSLFRPARH
ncbi:class 1 fructose-bisphosphatase [Nocardia terpenica]|uniref:Fructose-1,6-bisphosphatase class 1 n=1 Tax=Nocardia terpenica TaxID=455432 RepID=A0A164M0J3_9NOCA|nr:class 1 fructose-bisphosphatase [Nocardia terpenica]KZM72915.1 fructose-bisphosphatase [Nocardia terpenica]MBF6061162.1 class 1 fructose-bisphosphatase [Nocardia terpenica]MBF6105609.1 class 1 fructose-bisphosphatase [Nocardia terpenica]MBF6112921.1 class 1 fructose-bisphosphatase [Nocardia terpenica]MBF6119051.1 class 1 fructose-bisphosphatase [Nocardia terpenica]